MTLMICLNNQSNRSPRQGERRKRLMMKTCCKVDKQSLIYRSKHLKSFEIIETVDLIFNVCGYSFSGPQFKRYYRCVLITQLIILRSKGSSLKQVIGSCFILFYFFVSYTWRFSTSLYIYNATECEVKG